MPKQLNVNLAFTADTAKASQGLKALQQQLTQLMNTAATNSSSLGLTKDIKEATVAVAKLKTSLSNAMTSTGSLDLTKFNDSLKMSGMTLEQYRIKLSSLGSDGSQAFSQLVSQISQAEMPLRRSNALLSEMATTLANTARWQLSSSLLHGFIGGLQHAYGYAQDLNESLNNIRIVTGQSAEQMAQLAQKANQAAKELSTRTTDYTNASLIYYQQGLDDKAVEARTRTTLKLANVTRQSAEEVSNQMTAIWNNFDDGTKSLEYYADAITALGAKTASSSSEIAQGLSKFAAVADTIGLSYETATAALATVVAETRQSADTVGNAFKSIFSRLQSLKLGETLEDGVGLTKYSQALEKVGVQVLDINGELREADDIMSDLGDRWTKISDTQKTALAQTVAGQRQYAQFVALFDNWDKVQSNIGIAEGSEGTLQEQADIYAESWEASAKRVQASAEAIYQSLIDDKFFIGFNNLISDVLDRIKDLIQGLGGIPGVLTTIGALFTRVFSTQLSSQISRIGNNIKMMTKSGRQEVDNLRKEGNQQLLKVADEKASQGTLSGQAQSDAYKNQVALSETLRNNAEKMTDFERQTAQLLLDQNKALGEQAIKYNQIAESEQKRANSAKNKVLSGANSADLKDRISLEDSMVIFENASEGVASLESNFNSFIMKANESGDDVTKVFELMKNSTEEVHAALSKIGMDSSDFDNLVKEVEKGTITVKQFKDILNGIAIKANVELDQFTEKVEENATVCGVGEDKVKSYTAQVGKSAQALAEAGEKAKAAKNDFEGTNKALEEFGNKNYKISEQIVGLGSVLMSFASLINSVKSAIDIWNDEDLTWGEKALKIIPSVTMSLGMLLTALNGQSGAAAFAAVSHIPLIGAYITEKTEAVSAAIATGTFTGALKGLIASLGPIALAFAAVTTAVILFNKALSDNEKQSIEYRLKEAKKAAEEAKTSFEDAKTSAEQLQESFNKYDSVVEELSNCKTGTEEWDTALKNVNGTVLELLQNYPSLSKYTKNENGILSITDEGKEFLTKQANQKQYGAFGEMMASQQKVEETEREALPKDFAEYTAKYINDNIADYTQRIIALNSFERRDADGNVIYDGLEKIINQFADTQSLNPEDYIDTSIKSVLTHLNDSNNITMDSVNEIIKQSREDRGVSGRGFDGYKDFDSMLKMASTDDLMAVYSNLTGTSSEIFKESIENSLNSLFSDETFLKGLGDVDSYIAEVKTLTDEYADSIAGIILANEDLYENNEEIAGLAGDLYKKSFEEAIEDRKVNNIEQLAEEYKNLKLDGEEIVKQTKDSITISKNGEEKEYDQTQMVAYLAGIEAAEGLATSFDLLSEKTEKLRDSEEEYDKQLLNSLTNQTVDSKTLKEHVQSMSIENYKGEEIEPIRQQIAMYLDQMLGNGKDGLLKEETIKSFGKDTMSELIDMVLNGMENYDKDVKKAKDLGKDVLNEMYSDLFYLPEKRVGPNKSDVIAEDRDLGLELPELKNLKELILNTFEISGEEGSQLLSDFLFKNIDNLQGILDAIDSSSTFTEFQEQLANIDSAASEDVKILSLFYQILTKYQGVQTPQEKYASTKKITDKLNTNDTIEADDYKTLTTNLGKDIVENFFDPVADGTYKLVGKAENFKKAVDNITIKDFENKFKVDNENWTNEDSDQYLSTMRGPKEIRSKFKDEELTGIFGEKATEGSTIQKWIDSYLDTSSIKTLQEYQDLLKDIGNDAELTSVKAQEIWKNLDPSNLKISNLSFIKEEFEYGRIAAEDYQKIIDNLIERIESFSQLHHFLDVATPEQYSEALQRVLDQSGTGTLEALDEIDKAILNGKADAELMGSIIERIMGASDLTTLEQAQQLEDRQHSTQKVAGEHGGGEYEVTTQNYSDKDKGFGQVELAKNSQDLFDPQRLRLYNEGIVNIGDTSKLTASEVAKIGEAAIAIYKDSEFFSIEQQIKGIGDAFKIANGEIDPANLKIYTDSIKDIVLNANDLTLDEKFNLIKEELIKAGVPLEYLDEELVSLIVDSENLTLEEKFAKINEKGLDLKENLNEVDKLINDILGNEQTSTIEKLQQLHELLNMGADASSVAEGIANAIDQDKTTDIMEKQQIFNSMANEAPEKPGEIVKPNQKDNMEGAFDAGEQEQRWASYREDLATYNVELEAYDNWLSSISGKDFSSLDQLRDFSSAIPDIEGLQNSFNENEAIAEYASQFDRCADAVRQYNAALAQGQDTSEAIFNMDYLSRVEDAANKYGINADRVQAMAEVYRDQAEASEDMNETLLGDVEVEDDLAESNRRMAEAMTDAATRFVRFNDAIEDLRKNGSKTQSVMKKIAQTMEDTKQSAKEVAAGTQEYSDAMEAGKKTMSNLLNVEQKMLKDDFVAKHFDKAMDAANNVEGAYEELQEAFAQDLAADIDQGQWEKFAENANLSFADASAAADDFMARMAALPEGTSIDIDNEPFLQALIASQLAAGATAEDIESMLSGLGIDANVEPIMGDFQEVADAAAETGDAVIENTSFNAEATSQTVKNTDTVEAVGFDVATMSHPITTEIPNVIQGSPVKMGKNGSETFENAVVSGTTSETGWMDSVTVTPQKDDESETKEETITAVKVSNAHKSAGGKTSAGNSGGGGGGGGKGGGSCFVAGTLITTKNGYKNIENIQEGDIVLSYNEKIKQNQYSTVLQTMIHIVNENIYTLYIENDILKVTGIHKFLINRNKTQKWIAACDLKIGDFVLFADGTLHKINKIDVDFEILIPVYNFEVSNNHNYYVGINQILAHNKGSKARTPRSKAAQTKTVRKAGAEHVHTDTRYHELNKSLQSLSRQYDNLDKSKNLAFGKNHIKAIDLEIQKQKELNKLNEEYLQQIKTNKKNDLDNLKKSTGKIDKSADDKDDSAWNEYKISYQNTTLNYGKKKKKKNGKVVTGKDGKPVYVTDKKKIVESENTQYADVGLADLGINLQTDANGNILDFSGTMAQLDAWYNKQADAYTKYKSNLSEKATLEEKRQNQEIQNTWNRAQAIYESMKAKLEQYEQDVVDEMDKIDEIVDGRINDAALNLEKISYEVEIEVEINDNELERYEFILGALGDSAKTAAKAIGLLGKQMQTLSKNKDAYTQGIAKIFSSYTTQVDEIQGNYKGKESIFAFNTLDGTKYDGETIVKDLKENGKDAKSVELIKQMVQMSKEDKDEILKLTKEQLSAVQDQLDKRQQTFDKLNAAVDEYLDKLDYEVSKQQALLDISRSYLNVIELVGKTNMYTSLNKEGYRVANTEKARQVEKDLDEELNKQVDLRIEGIRKEQEAVAKMLDVEQTKYDDLKKLMDSTTDDNLKLEYEDELEKFGESLRTLTEKNNSLLLEQQNALIEALQQKQEAFERALVRAADSFNESMANVRGTLEILQNSMELREKVIDTYVADYEKVHQLRQLDLQAQKQIDEANDPKIQRKLLEIQEEINQKAYDGQKISQYELDYLRQKLELKQAEAALEDAQKAKTQVSLTRDNEGNFGYVYTANDADVADAEKNYEDKIYEMRKANAEYIRQIETDLIQAEIDYQNEMQEIANSGLDEAKKMAEMQRIQDEYYQLHMALTEQHRLAMNASNEIYGEYTDIYSEITGDLMTKQATYAKSFSDTILGQLSGYDTLEKRTAVWEESFKNYNKACSEAVVKFGTDCETSYGKVAKSADDYYDSFKTTTEKYTEDMQKFGEEIDKTAEKAEKGFKGIVEEINKNEEKYLGHLGTWIQEAYNLAEAVETAIGSIRELGLLDQGGGASIPQTPSTPNPSETPTTSTGQILSYGKNSKKVQKTIENKRQIKKLSYKAAAAVINSGRTKATMKSVTKGITDTAAKKKAVIKAAKKILKKQIAKKNIDKIQIRFDTGGYTGNWAGNEGKAAILHKKEMVLNQQDTSNILSAVSTVRDIASKIDLNALAQSGALSSGLSSGLNGVSNGPLEQQVYITADFPNATDRNEIAAAFDNIIGLAAQYANR